MSREGPRDKVKEAKLLLKRSLCAPRFTLVEAKNDKDFVT
jgi:hypothetical protein